MSGGREAPRDRGNASPLARARLAAGLTQGQLAEKIGCTQKDVSRWERGVQSPRMGTAIRMADALNVSLDELLKGRE